MKTLEALTERWLSDAETLERYREGAGSVARLHATELQEAIREGQDELLTLDQAAKMSGYSKRQLHHLLANESIPQAGRKGSPRIRVGDLPSKPKKPDVPTSITRIDRQVAAILGKS